ncbi:MAG: DUF6600 domain-containing protein [Armatimonadota bacterium]
MSNILDLRQPGPRRRLAGLGLTVSIACMALGLLLAVAQAPADAATYGRVSHIDGDLMLRGEHEDDWSFAGLNTTLREGDSLWTDADGVAEIELGYGIFVRIGYGTEIYLDELPRDAELRLVSGSVYVARDLRDGYARVLTPTAQVRVRKGSMVRVDAAEDGSTRIGVVRGAAGVYTDAARPSEIERGWRAFVYPGQGPSGWERLSRGDEDEFDEYNDEREEYYADFEVPSYVDRDIVGIRDLRRHGRWITVENAYYWRPYVSTWYPYRYGRWGWLYGGGWSWCDDYPFGYVTGHYGRWRWLPHHGWLWRPGQVWGPGWVNWMTFGDYVGWVPLDPWGRNARVSIGLSIPIGHNGYLSLGACSYAYRSHFGFGYVRARPFNHTTINIIRQKNVYVFNDRPGRHGYSYRDHAFGDRDNHNIGGWLRPERHARGPARNERGHVAKAVVERIENPRERAKRWSWRSRDVDLDTLKRFRETRPEHADGDRDDVRRGPDAAIRPGEGRPNISGREGSPWGRRPDDLARRPDTADRDEERGARESSQPSRDGGWRQRSGDEDRRATDTGSPAPDRRPSIWSGRRDDSRTPGTPGERTGTEGPKTSGRPTWLNRERSDDEARPRTPFGGWRNERGAATKPSAPRPEPEKPAATERTSPERRNIWFSRPKTSSGEEPRPSAPRNPFARPESKEPKKPATTERTSPERRNIWFSRPKTSSREEARPAAPRTPFVRPESKEPEPPRPQTRTWGNRSSSGNSSTSRPATPTARTGMFRPTTPRPQASRPTAPTVRTQPSQPARSIWGRLSTSPRRSVTPSRPTQRAEARESLSSRLKSYSGRSSSSSKSGRPSVKSSSSRSESSSSRSSTWRGSRSGSSKSSSGRSSRSSSSRSRSGGWGSRSGRR